MKKLTWKLSLTISVDEKWVEDGYEATPERIERILTENDMTWAHSWEYEVEAKAVRSPNPDRIRKLQGEQ